MTEQEVLQQEVDRMVADTLAHPDPSPDLLPAVIDPTLIRQEQTAAHLLRASLRLDTEIEATKARMDADMAAWAQSLTKLQDKREAWRAMVRDWMLRNGVTQIKCPWFTASIAKGRTRIVIDNESEAIARLRLYHGEKAIKVKETIIKAEFDAIFNAIPREFDGVAHEETSEPGLTVRKKE